MEIKNNALVIGLVALILGVGLGYYAGAQATPAVSEQPQVMHHTMTSMAESLVGKKGEALDKAFVGGMITHHEDAVNMANVLLKETKRPELIKLGNEIIAAQSKEIEMMQKWQGEWFGQ